MLSSTVPRLDDRWPPVFDTDSMRKARNSSASAGSSLRSSLRRSAGESMRSSRGYGDMVSAVFRSERAMNDEVGELAQPCGRVAERCQRFVRLMQQAVGERARFAHAQQGDVGRLVVLGILAGGLAQCGSVGLRVEEVVDDLEQQADELAVAVQAVECV